LNLIELLCKEQRYILYKETRIGPMYIYSGNLEKDSKIIWTQHRKHAKQFKSKRAVKLIIKKLKEKNNIDLRIEKY